MFVWGTVVCVPITLTVVFIWTLVESLQSNFVYEGEKTSSAKDTGLTIMSFIPLILNLLYIKAVFDNKHRINQTVSVIEVRCRESFLGSRTNSGECSLKRNDDKACM